MKIASHQIGFESRHRLDQTHKIEESLAVGTGKSPGSWDPNQLSDGVVYHRSSVESGRQSEQFASLEKQAKQLAEQGPDRGLMQAIRAKAPPATKKEMPTLPVTSGPKPTAPSFIAKVVVPSETPEIDAGADLEISLLKALVEAMTGKKIEIYSPSESQPPSASMEQPASPAADATASPAGPGEFGLRYHYSDQYSEEESLQVRAQGVVMTADGQKIQIDLEINLSRSFATSQQIDIQAGAGVLRDPLVVNFSGTAAELTKTKFAFDIDSDGTQDQISFVTPQSGFLAVDWGSNGKIDDGSELFGAATGNGFNELAKHDEDENGFIDENDSIYSKLRIFTKDASGNDQLFALGEKGIGAIYLGFTQSPYEIKDETNQLLGKVRSTGVFVQENGGIGSLQQLDLVV